MYPFFNKNGKVMEAGPYNIIVNIFFKISLVVSQQNTRTQSSSLVTLVSSPFHLFPFIYSPHQCLEFSTEIQNQKAYTPPFIS